MQTQVTPVVTENIADAMAEALKTASPDDLICVTGSLYLVADARQWQKDRRSRKPD
jgi:dihydrofolate synthase/folylpolyglutamate synthase